MRVIEITKGYKILVDDEDFERINSFKWSAQTSFNAKTGKETVRAKRSLTISTGVRKTHYISHEILRVRSWEMRGLVIDHADENPLNNQKQNLSIMTYSENAKNTRAFRERLGVAWDARKCKWRAYAPRNNSNPRHIGLFDSFEEALHEAKNWKQLCV